jgi:thiosulfate/3-mercaptopyruvate sulfurtransferase
VRAPERYRGDVEPIDAVAGHIPGARSVPYAGNLAPDGRFLPPEDLRRRYLAALDGVPPERTAVYCGSGVTSAHDLLAMELAGLKGAALYPGSWSEWIRDPTRAVERGDPSK